MYLWAEPYNWIQFLAILTQYGYFSTFLSPEADFAADALKSVPKSKMARIMAILDSIILIFIPFLQLFQPLLKIKKGLFYPRHKANNILPLYSIILHRFGAH